MPIFSNCYKIARHVKQQEKVTHVQEGKTRYRGISQTSQILELADKDFKRGIINMLTNLQEKMGLRGEVMWHFQRDRNTQEKYGASRIEKYNTWSANPLDGIISMFGHHRRKDQWQQSSKVKHK